MTVERNPETYDNKTANKSFWSPKGRHLVLGTLESNSRFDLEFWDLDLNNEGKPETNRDEKVGIQLIKTTEHYGMTEVEWDPSGRYVGVWGSIWQSSMEPGYALYDFKGETLVKVQLDKFKQLVFRPRPRLIFGKEKIKGIKRNLKEYSKQFDDQDIQDESMADEEVLNYRRRLVEEWNTWRLRTKKAVEEEKQEIDQERGDGEREKEEGKEWVEEYLEEVIDEKEEVV